MDVAVAGAITQGRRGELLAPMAEMAELGVRLFTDDGDGVQSTLVMRRALEYARPLGRAAGPALRGRRAERGGLDERGRSERSPGARGPPGRGRGRSWCCATSSSCASPARPLHFLHLSTRRSLDLVAAARAEGLPVTCEVAPHHFTLDESACSNYDPTFKVHPPLRGA